MGSSPVVVSLVLGQDQPQVPLAEDQHPVGNPGPGGEHEPRRAAVRARASGGIFTASIPAPARAASNDAALAGPVADREPEVRSAVTEVHEQVASLLGGPGAVRVAGDPGDVDCDTRSHVVSALVREVWLMPET